MKPVKAEQLEKMLEKVRRQRENTDGKLVIRHKGSMYVIPYKDIVYLESQLHKAFVVTRENSYECAERLEAIKERLNETFLTCHKSYIVNMEHIQEFGSGKVILNNGKVIPVSKNRYGEAKKHFFEYMSGKM